MPHAEQTPVVSHAVELEVQVPPRPPQQGWPGPPQAQVLVPATHVRFATHGEVPGQQTCPLTVPHAAQFPLAPHTAPALQAEPLQQTWPIPPQVMQLPPEQLSALVRHGVLPAQHFALSVPHATQLAPEQIVFAPVQLLPLQQAWPIPPHTSH